MLDGLDDVAWDSLTHAYGPASDVPDLVRGLLSAEPEVREKALWELYGTIFHQGTRYEASRFAVPFLTELAAEPTVADRHLIVSLLVDLGVGYQEEWLRSGFAADVVSREQDALSEADHEWKIDTLHVYDAVCAHVPSLIALAEEDPDVEVRRAATYALAFLPDAAPRSLPALERRIVEADDPESLANALLAYGLLRATTARSRQSGGPDLRRFLQDPHPLVRFAAASSCARLAAANGHTDDESIIGILDVLGQAEHLSETALRWNDGDLVGLGWITIEIGVPDFDVPLVRRACDALRAAEGPQAQTLAGVLLNKLFPSGARSAPASADRLSDEQRTFLETLADEPRAWTWEGMTFGNFSLMMAGFGLPGDAEAMRRYLAGDALEDCLPIGMRRAGQGSTAAPKSRRERRKWWRRWGS